MSKYRNVKIEIDGITFDSKAEARRYADLKILERIGEITELKRQVVYELAPSVVIAGRKRPALRYVADFSYFDCKSSKFVVEDVKGSLILTQAYVIKRHLMKSVHGIDILEFRTNANRNM